LSQRILGIDPGTRVVGYGVIDVEGTRMRLASAGTCRAAASHAMEQRLASLAAQLRTVLKDHGADTAAMEDAFVKADVRAALKIGQGRGALLAVLGEAGLEVGHYPPASVKKAVAGNGRAQKDQVARMVAAILGQPLDLPEDATDALAVAITHAFAVTSRLPTSP